MADANQEVAAGRKDARSKLRQSSRTKKLSAAMRVVDEETRKIVMQNRIDALEADNLFESNYLVDEEEVDDKGDVNDGGYAAEYVVEEADESEDISQDGETNNNGPSASKLKARKAEKNK